jgi:nucleotide-binding universal stress UspA family protein
VANEITYDQVQSPDNDEASESLPQVEPLGNQNDNAAATSQENDVLPSTDDLASTVDQHLQDGSIVDTTESNTANTVDTEEIVENIIEERRNEVNTFACPPGYEPDVFYALPDFMQREICEQHNETSQNTRELAEAAGYDYDTIMALPENIRQEILDQARREREAAAAAAGGGGLSDVKLCNRFLKCCFSYRLTYSSGSCECSGYG